MSEELLSITGIGRVLMGTLKQKYKITTRAEFLNANDQVVRLFDARLKRIWVREQLQAGKPNPALSAQDVDAAACERAVFDETKRTLVEVDASVVKAQEECKGPGAEKLESAINRQAWKTWVEQMKTDNKAFVKDIKDFRPSLTNPVSPYIVIESSTVPIWACMREKWIQLFGTDNIFKGAGPDEVFSDTIGALFFALTQDRALPAPDTFVYLNPQLEHLMSKYKMPFFRFLTNYYADYAGIKSTYAAFRVSQLAEEDAILFFAKHRIEPMHADSTALSGINWTGRTSDDFLFVYRATIDRKEDTIGLVTQTIFASNVDIIKTLVTGAFEEFERGRRNFCESYLRIRTAMNVSNSSTAEKPTTDIERNKLVKIILAERGPIKRMFDALGITVANLDADNKKAFATLLRDSVIDETTLGVTLGLIGGDLECWKILFDKDQPEPWKRRLIYNQGAKNDLNTKALAASTQAADLAQAALPTIPTPTSADINTARTNAIAREPLTQFALTLVPQFP